MHALYIFGVAASAFTALLLATPVPAAEVKVMNSCCFSSRSSCWAEAAPARHQVEHRRLSTTSAHAAFLNDDSDAGSSAASLLTC